MPFKSKSQMRAFFAMEDKGELPKGTSKKWVKHTRSIKNLPEKVAARYIEPNTNYKPVDSQSLAAESNKAERKLKQGGSMIQYRNELTAKNKGIAARHRSTPKIG